LAFNQLNPDEDMRRFDTETIIGIVGFGLVFFLIFLGPCGPPMRPSSRAELVGDRMVFEKCDNFIHGNSVNFQNDENFLTPKEHHRDLTPLGEALSGIIFYPASEKREVYSYDGVDLTDLPQIKHREPSPYISQRISLNRWKVSHQYLVGRKLINWERKERIRMGHDPNQYPLVTGEGYSDFFHYEIDRIKHSITPINVPESCPQTTMYYKNTQDRNLEIGYKPYKLELSTRIKDFLLLKGF